MNELWALLGGGGLLTSFAALIVAIRKVGPQARELRIANEQRVTAMYDDWAAKQDKRFTELQQRFDELDARYDQLTELVAEHAQWDREAVAEARKVGLVLPTPPPLRIPA